MHVFSDARVKKTRCVITLLFACSSGVNLHHRLSIAGQLLCADVYDRLEGQSSLIQLLLLTDGSWHCQRSRGWTNSKHSRLPSKLDRHVEPLLQAYSVSVTLLQST